MIATGPGNDEARWDVQRDLPRILLDGAAGKAMVARVERVEFGQYGCLYSSHLRRVDQPAHGLVRRPGR